MERITIIDKNNVRLTLLISNNTIYYINHNNSKIDINKYIDMLRIDNVTDYFNNNGSFCICYKNNGVEKTNTKKFRIKDTIVLCSLTALLLISPIISIFNPNIIEISIPTSYAQTEEFSLGKIKSLIYSSPYLSTEEKDFIYNEDFFTDILSFMNQSNYSKYFYYTHLKEMRVISYGKKDSHYKRDEGYYLLDHPNELFIKDYLDFNEIKSNVIAHELVHLCQDTTGYNLIYEACAEIISNEYFGAKLDSYLDQVLLVKRLMEIIGSKPIWIYSFTGDFSLIENEVKPYLSNEDYESFLDCLTFDYDKPDQNKFKKLEELLSKIYTAKYNKNINDDDVLKYINAVNVSLVRYYFNQRHTESYFTEYNNMVDVTMDLDTAIETKKVLIYLYKTTPISYEEYKNLEMKPNYVINRVYYPKEGITIKPGKSIYNNKEYINCEINGVFYKEADVDILCMLGFLDVSYTLEERVYLNAEEYINGYSIDGYTLKVLESSSTTINDDYTVSTRVPNIYYLPEVKESYHL